MVYYFLSYCCAGFLLFLSGRIRFALYTGKESTTRYLETGNVIFALIEYAVFYYYFKTVLRAKLIKAFMLIAMIVLVAVSSLFLFSVFFSNATGSRIMQLSDLIISPELIFLGILCLCYYLELLRKRPSTNLSTSPSFWIVTGLFFYTLVIPPFFLIISDDFEIQHRTVFDILAVLHYISFAFLFLAITKAILCRKPLTT